MGRVKKPRPTAKNERAAMLTDIEADLTAARDQDRPSFQAIAGLQRLKAQLLGIDAPPQPKRRPPRVTGDHLVDHLAMLRDLLHTAIERGSVDSAARLTVQVATAIEKIDARAAEAKARDLDGMSEDQVVEMVVSDLMELPLPLRLRIRQALAD